MIGEREFCAGIKLLIGTAWPHLTLRLIAPQPRENP
jgi:hypothetical protein